ncbi:hypothetical protein LTS17_002495 [Exophiala oligosperma]
MESPEEEEATPTSRKRLDAALKADSPQKETALDLLSEFQTFYGHWTNLNLRPERTTPF